MAHCITTGYPSPLLIQDESVCNDQEHREEKGYNTDSIFIVMHHISTNNMKGYDHSMLFYFLSIRKINPGQGYSSMVEDLSRIHEAMNSIPALKKETPNEWLKIDA